MNTLGTHHTNAHFPCPVHAHESLIRYSTFSITYHMFSTVTPLRFSVLLCQNKKKIFFFFFKFWVLLSKDKCGTQSKCFTTRLWCWGGMGIRGVGDWLNVWSRMVKVFVSACVCLCVVGSSLTQTRPKRTHSIEDVVSNLLLIFWGDNWPLSMWTKMNPTGFGEALLPI